MSFLLALSTLFALDAHPIATGYPPDSVLDNPPQEQILFVGPRTRFSTCTGVAWFPGDAFLISADYIKGTLQTYQFDPLASSLTPLETLDPSITCVSCAENLSFSPDGKLLVVISGLPGAVTFYRVDRAHSKIQPKPILTLTGPKGTRPHGGKFSTDGKTFAFVTYDDPSRLFIYRVSESSAEAFSLQLCQTVVLNKNSMRSKGIHFSGNGRFLAICYGPTASQNPIAQARGILEIHSFDSQLGMINPRPISHTEEYLDAPEDLIFTPDGSSILVSNQANDTLSIYPFNQNTGKLGKGAIALQNPDAQLSFPHGFSFSWDNRYLACSNYGDDKVTIYKINGQ